jgi:hypothetical protein
MRQIGICMGHNVDVFRVLKRRISNGLSVSRSQINGLQFLAVVTDAQLMPISCGFLARWHACSRVEKASV